MASRSSDPALAFARSILALALAAGCAPEITPRGGPDARTPPLESDAGMPRWVEDDAGAALDAGADADAGRPIDAGAVDDAGLDAGSADGGEAPDGGTCVPGECCYRTVETRPGVFHTVTDTTPQRVLRPLAPSEGFYCLRASYTVRTVDNLAATDAAHEGCPIYSHVATVAGGTAAGRVLGTAYFRFLRLGCDPRRPAALELNAWNAAGDGNLTLTGPWLPGETFRVVQEIRPFTSSIQLHALDGTPIGPRVEVDISGATVEMTRDAELSFGLDRVYENAFFPYFGATYSDLVVEADVAPPR